MAGKAFTELVKIQQKEMYSKNGLYLVDTAKPLPVTIGQTGSLHTTSLGHRSSLAVICNIGAQI